VWSLVGIFDNQTVLDGSGGEWSGEEVRNMRFIEDV